MNESLQNDPVRNGPLQLEPRRIDAVTSVLNAWLPVPGFGVLPVNSFLLQTKQPVLVDTGLAMLGEPFREHLFSLIEPRDLQWIWITHADPDHLGNLQAILQQAPQARVVTSYLGMGKMSMQGITPERIMLLNPGQTLNVGDRELLAVSPPVFDAPETCGLFDTSSRTLFSADSFGGLLQQPAEAANEINTTELQNGCIGWATVDAPWLHQIDETRFDTILQSILDLKPETILSSHLPPAYDMCDDLLGFLRQAIHATPFIGPDQASMDAILAA